MNRDNWHSRWKKKHGDFAVPCMVTDRWLEFSQDGSTKLNEGEALTLHVMTRGSNDKAKKLCEMFITREDLLNVLELIEKPPSARR